MASMGGEGVSATRVSSTRLPPGVDVSQQAWKAVRARTSEGDGKSVGGDCRCSGALREPWSSTVGLDRR